jgi:hypothetical protein
MRRFSPPPLLQAVTEWEVVEKLGAFSLVRFRPQQGRTHQIRLHALYMGHPLLCDRTYGGGVAFSDAELRVLAVSHPHVRLPLLVGESGDEGGRLRDLLSTADLTAVSPPLAAQVPEHYPALTDLLREVRAAGLGASRAGHGSSGRVDDHNAGAAIEGGCGGGGETGGAGASRSSSGSGSVIADRCMLHANVLELRHPATGAPTRIEAPLPDDMERVLEVLRTALAT